MGRVNCQYSDGSYTLSITRSRKWTKMGMCCCYHRIVEATYFPQLDTGAMQSSPPRELQEREDKFRNQVFSVTSIIERSDLFNT